MQYRTPSIDMREEEISERVQEVVGRKVRVVTDCTCHIVLARKMFLVRVWDVQGW